ncbi:hypothetical protein K438DRAFT_1965683 [Mycena galopus ATCC 62051]|nr:hypothetical protein K438DRAFT_1965683 [Mycena galopus ATCC 62051]
MTTGPGHIVKTQAHAFVFPAGPVLSTLHSNVQNDWFGLPSATPPADPSYDWQETFTLLLQTLLDDVPALHPSLNLAAIADTLRPPLARAISAFLFADPDTSSFVWFTGSPEDVFLAFTPEGALSTFAILPAVAYAL